VETKTFSVPGVHCGHCEAAVKGQLEPLTGVDAVDVDLERKVVAVRGERLDSVELLSAIDEAGYDAEEVAA
jgi:copper chaperone